MNAVRFDTEYIVPRIISKFSPLTLFTTPFISSKPPSEPPVNRSHVGNSGGTEPASLVLDTKVLVGGASGQCGKVGFRRHGKRFTRVHT